MNWYDQLPSSERKRDFKVYLEKRRMPRICDDELTRREKEFISLVALPLLEKDGEFNEWNMTDELAQRWDMTVGQMIDKIHDFWREMNRKLSTREAAQLLGVSSRTIQRMAPTSLFGEKGRRGQWYFTHEILIDHEVA
ncbi:DNA-binding protein [Candidatus Parcubacteria bacterium]|nr:MAG: DNA-binding protein [Candidatus Parcubacteria bacterium]